MAAPKRWEDMTADEKADQLRNELMQTRNQLGHQHNQIGSLQMQINEIGEAVKALERKMGSNK
jgi:hypothetical protein